MGWEVEERTGALYRVLPDGGVTGLPWFSGSCDAARELENEIEWRGLWKQYIFALIEVMEPGVSVDDLVDAWRPMWLLLRATPEQRARAFLEAVRGTEDGATRSG
jgi:hypothetical protein